MKNNCIQDKKLKSTEIIKCRISSLYNDDNDNHVTPNDIGSIINVIIQYK